MPIFIPIKKCSVFFFLISSFYYFRTFPVTVIIHNRAAIVYIYHIECMHDSMIVNIYVFTS